jgi:hypothetical protein
MDKLRNNSRGDKHAAGAAYSLHPRLVGWDWEDTLFKAEKAISPSKTKLSNSLRKAANNKMSELNLMHEAPFQYTHYAKGCGWGYRNAIVKWGKNSHRKDDINGIAARVSSWIKVYVKHYDHGNLRFTRTDDWKYNLRDKNGASLIGTPN